MVVTVVVLAMAVVGTVVRTVERQEEVAGLPEVAA